MQIMEQKDGSLIIALKPDQVSKLKLLLFTAFTFDLKGLLDDDKIDFAKGLHEMIVFSQMVAKKRRAKNAKQN